MRPRDAAPRSWRRTLDPDAIAAFFEAPKQFPQIFWFFVQAHRIGIQMFGQVKIRMLLVC